MRTPMLLASLLLAACSGDPVSGSSSDQTGVRIVNGFGASVDVLVDGMVRQTALPSGGLASIALAAGARSLIVRPSGTSTASTLAVQVAAGHLTAVAATRGGGGALLVQALDDTNTVVPAGATKLRVLHLAASAGEVQVWRTQPDYQTPTRWAFPFTYNTANVYYQSTPGAWEVRVWTDTTVYRPGNAAGWTTAVDTARVTLSSGRKATVVILDRTGGGVRVEVIE